MSATRIRSKSRSKFKSNISPIPSISSPRRLQLTDKGNRRILQGQSEDKFHKPKEAKVRYISIGVAPEPTLNKRSRAGARRSRRQRSARRQRFRAAGQARIRRSQRRQRRRSRLDRSRAKCRRSLDKQIFSSGKGRVSEPSKRRRAFRSLKSKISKKKKPRRLKEATRGNHQDT